MVFGQRKQELESSKEAWLFKAHVYKNSPVGTQVLSLLRSQDQARDPPAARALAIPARLWSRVAGPRAGPRIPLRKSRGKAAPTGFRDGSPSPEAATLSPTQPNGPWEGLSRLTCSRKNGRKWGTGRPEGRWREKTRVQGSAAASHLRQAPAGNRAAARGRACNPRSGDPTEVSSPAGSN